MENRQLWLQLKRSSGIMRRYFVVNGFDGALTMLGLLTGFYLGDTSDLTVVIGACVGATVALGVSGLTGAYLSESAERQRSLTELEEAMLADLSDSAAATNARLLSLTIALVNGAAPVMLSLIIILPLWLHHSFYPLPMAPLPVAIATAFVCLFALGIFLGRVAGTSWWQSGIKSLLIAVATVAIILLVE